MVNRFPREPRRFPRIITKKDIDAATEKNGTVNLSKIRQAKNRNKNEKNRRSMDTRKRNQEIFDVFVSVYKEFTGTVYVANKHHRIISYCDSKGELRTRRYKTDYTRLVEFYNKIDVKYNINIDEFKEYIKHALRISIVEFEHTQRNHIFGFVVSEKIAEKYFMRKRRKESSKKEKDNLRDRHRRYFRKNNE